MPQDQGREPKWMKLERNNSMTTMVDGNLYSEKEVEYPH